MAEHAHGVDPVGAFLLFLNLLVLVVVAVLLRLNRPGGPTADWRLKDQSQEGTPDAPPLEDG